MPLRHLIILLGDQLDHDSAALEGFDPAVDAVWMAEVPAEATYAWSHKARLVIFLSAMRHFAASLRERGWTVHYRATGEHPFTNLADALAEDVVRLKPQAVIAVEPGEVVDAADPILRIVPDRAASVLAYPQQDLEGFFLGARVTVHGPAFEGTGTVVQVLPADRARPPTLLRPYEREAVGPVVVIRVDEQRQGQLRAGGVLEVRRLRWNPWE